VSGEGPVPRGAGLCRVVESDDSLAASHSGLWTGPAILAACVAGLGGAASCGAAALVAFAVSSALDFDWHLPAPCLWAGWATGLACPPAPLPETSAQVEPA
jgi:hypothetical protein